MTVNELIEQLQKMPTDGKVEICAKYEKGPGAVRFFEVDKIESSAHNPDTIIVGITETKRFC